MRRHTRQQHQANTAAIASSASSVLAVSIAAPFGLTSSLDRGSGLFLRPDHKSNLQPRRAISNPCAPAAKVTYMRNQQYHPVAGLMVVLITGIVFWSGVIWLAGRLWP